MVQHVMIRDGQVLELEDDEIATLVKEAQNEGAHRSRIIMAKAASVASPLHRQSWCWAMTFLIAAVVVLLTTDSLQVHVSVEVLSNSRYERLPIQTIKSITNHHQPTIFSNRKRKRQ